MAKILKFFKFLFLLSWTACVCTGIGFNYQRYDLKDWLIILIVSLIPYIVLLKPKKKPKKSEEVAPLSDINNFFKLDVENRSRIITESMNLIQNSKNIDTVLSRIRFLKSKENDFVFDEIKFDYDELQIDGITRCLEIGINSTKSPDGLPKLFDKFFAIVHTHDDEFSDEVKSYVAELENGCWSKCDITRKVKPPLDFSEDELKFITAFRNLAEPLGLNNDIQIDRKSNGDLNFTYRNMQIGRVHLKRKKSMQLLRIIDEFYNVDVNWIEVNSVDAAISFLDNWVSYLSTLIDKEDIIEFK